MNSSVCLQKEHFIREEIMIYRNFESCPQIVINDDLISAMLSSTVGKLKSFANIAPSRWTVSLFFFYFHLYGFVGVPISNPPMFMFTNAIANAIQYTVNTVNIVYNLFTCVANRIKIQQQAIYFFEIIYFTRQWVEQHRFSKPKAGAKLKWKFRQSSYKVNFLNKDSMWLSWIWQV